MERSLTPTGVSFSLSAGARNLLPSLLVFTILVLLALVVLPPLVDRRDTLIAANLDRTQALAASLIEAENGLQQMQADARGYIITQSPAFREQYRAATAALPDQLQQLGEIGAQANPTLVAQLEELVAAIERWQRESLDRQVMLVEQGRLSDVAADLAVGESQGRFDAIRSRIQHLHTQLVVAQDRLRTQASQARTLQTTTPPTPAEVLIVAAVADGRDVLIGDTQAADLPPELAALARALPATRSGLVLPLRGRAQAFGALVLTSRTPHAFDPDDLAFYTTLASERVG